ncbi:MAG: recombinase family protein, partial [Magnetococcales bacterium]|nr:recombinase family protein [Magnetococcales bacterium]
MTDQPIRRKVRCAIYTRKSSEEGLEQDFNSLDAQREACESYITSQKQEGWVLVPDHYDDGGFSGGTLQRPALQRLLNDIKEGAIDCCVVYKIDRMSRSLLDFTKLVEIFDRHNVTFVSITQSFNTTTSMGRLTLNVLLSFAQYEREIIAERIRDKVAASRKKGIWMGGFPPLGYDIENRRLVVNPTEARLVRHIFQRLLDIGSITLLVKELNDAGHTTKAWTSLSTRTFHPGRPFDRGILYKLLQNRVYLGESVHKGTSYPGEHDAIISQDVWDKVQHAFASNRHQRSNRTRARTPSPLKGVMHCRHCNRTMTA